VPGSPASSAATGGRSPQARRALQMPSVIGPKDGYFEEMSDAEWDAAFALGTMSGMRSIRAALSMLRAADRARIVTCPHTRSGVRTHVSSPTPRRRRR